MPGRSLMSSVRVERQGWGGEYEPLDHPAGVVALLCGGNGSAVHVRERCAVLHESGFSTLWLDAARPPGLEAMAARLIGALEWLREASGGAPLGVFGCGPGAAAVLHAAACRPGAVAALVVHGELPEAVVRELPRVQAATLLLVGDADAAVLQAHRRLLPMLGGARRLEVVPGAAACGGDAAANHAVAHLAAHWFAQQLPRRSLH